MNKLIEYLPPYLQRYRELINITEAEYPEVDEVRKSIDLVMNEQFVATLDEYGCERWEAMLKIIIKPTDDLPLRRFRILSKLLSDLPYTERALRNVLTNLCGEKWYSLDIRHNDYYIMIWIEVEQMEQQQIVIDTVKRMIPANLILDVQINFRSHGWIKEHTLTHGGLHKYSHRGIRTIVL